MRFPLIIIIACMASLLSAQDVVHPTGFSTPVYHDVWGPIRDFHPLSQADREAIKEKASKKILNPEIGHRSYPYQKSALPHKIDKVWQKQMGQLKNKIGTIQNFEGQNTTAEPPDANCMAGTSHVMQTVNFSYAIYSKTGNQIIAPTSLDSLFKGLPNMIFFSGDPLIIYDESASRWVAVGITIDPANKTSNYVDFAVSKTDDPTGEWYRWAFKTEGIPDFEKVGVWKNGYYMGTNTDHNNNIFVIERDSMIAGAANPRIVKFINPWISHSEITFNVTMPVDTDGPFAKDNSPGIFMSLNDDAVSGSADALWIYECSVNWDTIVNSTFKRVQQLLVEPFNGNFGSNFNNIVQKGTPIKLEANPSVLSYRAQYRNFDTVETIMCNHTVNIDGNGHAGIRWYELQKKDSLWSIRQQSTYGPDEHNRWMGSIAMNSNHEIALGYSITSSNLFPGIRYAAQSAEANANATDVLDIAEETIQESTNYSVFSQRWGDYSCMSVDPVDNETFWFTTEYIKTTFGKQTKIAAIKIDPTGLSPNFESFSPQVKVSNTTKFFDFSTGNPDLWQWTFNGGQPDTYTGQNPPEITYDSIGTFDVSLRVSNSDTSKSLTKPNYIEVFDCNVNTFPYAEGFENNGVRPFCWNNEILTGSSDWQFCAGNGGIFPSDTAYSGSYNAAFLNSNDDTVIAQLVTPNLNFSTYSNASLTFWYDLHNNGGLQKSLSVYYKSSDTSSWKLIKTLDGHIFQWTKDSIVLPDITNNYLIAFRGATSNNGAITLDAVTINANPKDPVADFSAEPLTGPIPHTVKFTDHSSGHVNAWHWDFGDGEESPEQHPEHTYNSEGQYNVSLTAIGSGVTSTKTREGYISVLAGIDDNQDKVYLVYPNPVKNTLTIEFPDAQQRTIVLSNNLGNRILSKKSKLKKDEIFMGNLSSGIYWLSILENEKASVNIKVVRE